MAKKVKFLKDHLRHKAGEKALITDESAAYFIRCKVAVEVTDVPEKVQGISYASMLAPAKGKDKRKKK